MASTLDKKEIKNDNNFVFFMIIIVIFNIWFFSAPSKRMTQFDIWSNTITYKIAKMTNNDLLQESIYHRNNAIYLIRLNDKRKTEQALKEIDKAIDTAPKYVSETVMQDLYKDRAYIKLCAGDRKGALNDLLQSSELTDNEYLMAAVLSAEREVYGIAFRNCQNILKKDYSAILGYVCFAHVYERSGRPGPAMVIYDYAIRKQPDVSTLYLERALLKQRMNNFSAYEKDIAIAKAKQPVITEERSMVEEVLDPKNFKLEIKSLK